MQKIKTQNNEMSNSQTNSITDGMRNELRRPLPEEAVSQHPTKKFLSTIKAIYVIERLNDVFGVGSWRTKSEFIEKQDKMIVCKTTLFIDEYGIEVEAFGGNDNTDLGDAYKGAVTDAITKIGSYLEIGIDVFKGIKPEAQKPKTGFIEIENIDKKILDKFQKLKNKENQYFGNKVVDDIKENQIEQIEEELRLTNSIEALQKCWRRNAIYMTKNLSKIQIDKLSEVKNEMKDKFEKETI